MLRGKLRQAFEQIRFCSSRFLLHNLYCFFAWQDEVKSLFLSMRSKCIGEHSTTRRPREGIMLKARRVWKLLCKRISAEVESMIYEKNAYTHYITRGVQHPITK
jgi:hypothetical protein